MGSQSATAKRAAVGLSFLLAVLVLAACAPRAVPQAARVSAGGWTAEPSARPTASPRPKHSASVAARPKPLTVPLGVAGSFLVGQQRLTFTEPAHTGPTGESLGSRTLPTHIWYPRATRAGGPAAGPFPLLMFAPGFQYCTDSYASLLASWASAGYVVAGIDFPRTSCRMGAAAYEPDLVNQPDDVSYVLTRLLALSSQPSGQFSGMLDRGEIGAAGHSDGGDTVAALAANPCCVNHLLDAVAVLSGAEWGPMPGRYFAVAAPPMLFTQGSADNINPPWTSVQLYSSDTEQARYYLDLFGANHLVPYVGSNPVEGIVSQVTIAFFDRYVLHQDAALKSMTAAGNASGAELLSGGQPVP